MPAALPVSKHQKLLTKTRITKMKLLLSSLLVGTTAPLLVTSFSPSVRKQPAALISRQQTSALFAIIYGWDGEDTEEEETTSSSTPSYFGFGSELGAESCPPDGIAVAESLSNDRDRMGSFARLAVAFSPPERGLGIQDIERVEVTCVRDNKIELEAMLCEHTGCVSLSVPIQFPNDCGGEWLDSGCVIQNLDALENKAESYFISTASSANEQTLDNADLEELCLLNENVAYPNWWVPPECDANLAADCNNIKSLLNEAEFHRDIVTLAQDGLGHHVVGQSGDYIVRRAKVAAVGPAGICLKVAAVQQSLPGRGVQYMDVVYPFGGTPVKDADALRAVVLGVIAAAEDQRPADPYQSP